METPNQAPDQKRTTVLKTLNFSIEFGFIIALPLVAFGFLGKYLDTRLHTKYFVLIGIILAILSSTLWLTKRIKAILRDLKNR